jgi:hypothetical protein
MLSTICNNRGKVLFTFGVIGTCVFVKNRSEYRSEYNYRINNKLREPEIVTFSNKHKGHSLYYKPNSYERELSVSADDIGVREKFRQQSTDIPNHPLGPNHPGN